MFQRARRIVEALRGRRSSTVNPSDDGEFFSPCPSGEECIRQTRSIPPRQVHPGRSALSDSEAAPRSYPATSRVPSRRYNGEGSPRTEPRPVRDVQAQRAPPPHRARDVHHQRSGSSSGGLRRPTTSSMSSRGTDTQHTWSSRSMADRNVLWRATRIDDTRTHSERRDGMPRWWKHMKERARARGAGPGDSDGGVYAVSTTTSPRGIGRTSSRDAHRVGEPGSDPRVEMVQRVGLRPTTRTTPSSASTLVSDSSEGRGHRVRLEITR